MVVNIFVVVDNNIFFVFGNFYIVSFIYVVEIVVVILVFFV